MHDHGDPGATGGQVGRDGDVPAEPDDDVRLDVRIARAAPATAARSRPGRRSRSAEGLRGNGTRGTTASS